MIIAGRPKLSSSGRVKLGGFELGKELAEKSKGLFSADDWQCKTSVDFSFFVSLVN